MTNHPLPKDNTKAINDNISTNTSSNTTVQANTHLSTNMQRPRTNRRNSFLCQQHHDENSAINVSDLLTCNINNDNATQQINIRSRSTRFAPISILLFSLVLASSSPFVAHAFTLPSPPASAISVPRQFRAGPFQIHAHMTQPLATSTTARSMIEKAIYEVDSNGNNVAIKSYKSNTEAQASSHVMKNRIVKLLSDDHGEEDDEIPDYSLEAANEVADKSVYSRISEEAKWKANAVMQKSNGDIASSLIETKVIAIKSKSKPVTKVMASVKETGGDSIGEYVKSIGSHELLPQESEMLLGKHIQLLVKWEESRGEMEEALDRYVFMSLVFASVDSRFPLRQCISHYFSLQTLILLCRPPTFGEWSEQLVITVPQLKKQIRRSQRAKAALIEANLRLVVTVARQTVKQGKTPINFQDACQEGIIGLSIACEKFDPSKGFRFSTYAVWWIRREVQKNVNQQSRSVRLPASAMKKINDIRINERLLMTTLGRKPTEEELASKTNISLKKLLFYKESARDVTSLDKGLTNKAGKGSAGGGAESNGKTLESLIKDAGPTPETIAEKEMFQTDVRRLIKTLSPREQAVIRLRFGLDDGTPKTLDFIATKFSVDKERIRKVEAKALLKLRQPYRNQSVKCYISDL